MTHVMLDLETIGTTPGCAIASVGACTFSMDGVHDTFYRVVDIGAGANQHLTWPHFSASTIEWWLCQSEAARAIFDPMQTTRHHIDDVLYAFKEWCPSDTVYLWCHGAGFDAPILEAAYVALWPGQCPYKFWNVRDTRTVYALADVAPDRAKGTHHNALDDAVAQAHAVIAAHKALGVVLQ